MVQVTVVTSLLIEMFSFQLNPKNKLKLKIGNLDYFRQKIQGPYSQRFIFKVTYEWAK